LTEVWHPTADASTSIAKGASMRIVGELSSRSSSSRFAPANRILQKI
jgi:hypothetical protein